MSKFDFLTKQLDDLEAIDMLRTLRCVHSSQGPLVQFDDGEKIIFCSNNYLDLANNDQIKQAVITAIQQYGTGTAASRLISGTMQIHQQLENGFAKFFNKESSLLFSSGWVANQALLTTLLAKGDLVLMDKLDHASIIDGVMQSPAEFRTYRTNELDRLEKYLADEDYNRKFIVTESVFSMDGCCADIKALVDLKNKYNAILIVDEAHSVGCMGPTGVGLCEQLGVLDEIDIIVSPLGKAFSANGCIIASDNPIIDYLINKARGFIYTTSPSVANCAAIIAALDIIKSEPDRREKLQENAEHLRLNLQMAGMDTMDSTTHIVPVLISKSQKAMLVSKYLYEAGYFVAAIRPPTVAKGTARLRISVQYGHTNEQIENLAFAIQDAYHKAMAD